MLTILTILKGLTSLSSFTISAILTIGTNLAFAPKLKVVSIQSVLEDVSFDTSSNVCRQFPLERFYKVQFENLVSKLDIDVRVMTVLIVAPVATVVMKATVSTVATVVISTVKPNTYSPSQAYCIKFR